MAENYNFSPKTTVATAVQKKLAIEKMPVWAQNTEQIQKFFDDAIQYWFTPEQRKKLDGYIGDRSSQSAFDKVFINEVSTERELYQLIPTMVSIDDNNNILSKLTYQDLVDSLGHYGSESTNQTRLLTGKFYSWAPPINPDMIINFNNYYWDTLNDDGLADLDYVVIQRGALDGNSWSRANHWYHINETTINDSGETVNVIDPEEIYRSGQETTSTTTNRFVAASRPIIQYNKNIELMNHGTTYRGEVTVVSTSLEPEDIILRPTTDTILIDDVFIRNDMTILFTGISNSGENNRVYRVVTKIIGGVEYYSLVLDPDFTDVLHQTGDPVVNDSIYVQQGTVYSKKTIHWGSTSWVFSQQKETQNQYPLFNLYNIDKTSLSDTSEYQGTSFSGNSLFKYKEDPTTSYDSVLGFRAATDDYDQYVFNNAISNESYTYTVSGVFTNIEGVRFYRVINGSTDTSTDEYLTDWVLSEVPTKQYVTQTFRPEVGYVTGTSGYSDASQSFYKGTYELAVLPDIISGSIRDIKVKQSGSTISSDLYEVTDKDGNAYVSGTPYITLDIDNLTILSDDVFSIAAFSDKNIPNSDIGSYEVPFNLKSNAKNEPVTDIAISDFFNHFVDIIENQTNFSGLSNSSNNYWETAQDMSKGRMIVQHEGSLLPLMAHNVSDNLTLIDAILYSQYEYNRFRNKFKNTLNSMDDAGTLTKELTDTISGDTYYDLIDTSDNIVRSVISKINVGKNTTMPFADSGMASTTAMPNTYIPATPQYLGILPTHVPEIRVKRSFNGLKAKYYNIDHTGALSLSNYQGDVVSSDINYRNLTRIDQVFLALELMIYNSIYTDFTQVDYLPRLSYADVRPNANRKTLYSPYVNSVGDVVKDYDDIANVGFTNWTINNGVTLGTIDVTDDWRSWNWSSTNYTSFVDRDGNVGTVSARGNWRGIMLDHYDTVSPHITPWVCLGFTQKPNWWDSSYGSPVSDVDGVYYYSSAAMWSDIMGGVILSGDREGVDSRFARIFGNPSEINASGRIVLRDPVDLGLVNTYPAEYEKSTPWKYGDVSDVEFAYLNSHLSSFDHAASIYRARPAEWCSYFWQSTNFKVFDINGNIQWLNSEGTSRSVLNSSQLVHGEDGEVIGYQMWVSDNLRKDHRDITTYYGDVVRNLDVRLSYRLGGFGKVDNLTFVSDSFGLIAQENIHLVLNKSSVRRQEVMSGVNIVWDGSGYIISGFDTLSANFSYFKPVTTGKKGSVTINNKSFVKYKEWAVEASKLAYNTRLKSRQDVYNFIVGYGLYLVSKGWIFEEYLDDSSLLDWESMASSFVQWSFGSISESSYVTLNPSSKTAKFGSTFGNIQSVAQYSGGTWTLIDADNNGINTHEIDTARIGNVMTLRMDSSVAKKMMLIRLDVCEYEHMIIFDNTTIFNDLIYLPEYGLYQDKLRVYGVITDSWNGRLEAPGFMVTETDTLPSFEKLVDDFRHYYDEQDPTSSVQLNNLARHMIGFQSRDYLSSLILNETNQLAFYKGFIKEKGTMQSFDKILRTSKRFNTSNYKTYEEWAIKLAEYGKLGGSKKLEFLIKDDQLKQNPQIVSFDATAHYDSDKDDTISFFGSRGDDARWLTRSSNDQEFPLVDQTYFDIDLPSAGPVTLYDVDFISEDLTTLAERRKNYEANNDTIAESVWVLKDNSGDWVLYDINHNTNVLLERIVNTDGVSTLYFSHNHNLQQRGQFYISGDVSLSLGTERFYTQTEEVVSGDEWDDITEYPQIDPNTSDFYVVEYQNRTYQAVDRGGDVSNIPLGTTPGTDETYWVQRLEPTIITVNLDLTDIDYTSFDVQPYLVSYSTSYGNGVTRSDFITERTVQVVNSSAFNRPVIYNQVSNQTESYLTIWDPARGIIPGIAETEIKVISQTDPALYNNEVTTAAAWGSAFVGDVWWDTTNALYLDYTQPIRNDDGSINDVLTSQYRRENWGKLLPGSDIVLKEWVRSPVLPGEWDDYVDSQSELNKSTSDNVASGTADLENWCEIDEYDVATNTTRTYYYFWVTDAIYVPKAVHRTRSISELTRIIESPSELGLPWFAPTNVNEFIVSGFQDVISNEDSVLQLTYTDDPDNSMNQHKEWELVRETKDGNVSDQIWDKMFESLIGEEARNGTSTQLIYPGVDLGTFEHQTWFKDIDAARREFVYVANEYYSTQNITSDSTLMSSIFNHANEPEVLNALDFTIINDDGLYLIDIPGASFSENNSVVVTTTGTLPSPLTTSLTFFIHVRDDGYYQLKTLPSQSDAGSVVLTDKGLGDHSIVLSSLLNVVSDSYLDMTDFWELSDWYREGYTENSAFIDVDILPSSTIVQEEGTIYRVYDSSGLWTLYTQEFTRDVPYWQTVGRYNGTIQLNDELFSDHDKFNSDGTVSDKEVIIRSALNLLKGTFNEHQSHILFGLLYYVHQEQPVVDWAFKTSYIYVFGIEQALSNRYTVLLTKVDNVIDYFNEAKPYRTKIRSSIEQKTSDVDSVITNNNDADPDTTEQDKYFDFLSDEANGTTVSPENRAKLRFREQMMQMFFDKVQSLDAIDTSKIQDYIDAFKKFSNAPDNLYGPNQDILDAGSEFALQPESIIHPYGSDIGIFFDSILINLKSAAQELQPTIVTNNSWELLLSEFTDTFNNITYLNVNNFYKIGQNNWTLTINQLDTMITNAFSELNDLIAYMNQANRLKIYDTNISSDEVKSIMEYDFNGTVIDCSPNTRLPVGYSSNSDDDENGHTMLNTTLYDHLLNVRGFSVDELIEMGFSERVSNETYPGFIIDAKLNDKAIDSNNPLINDSGMYLNLTGSEYSNDGDYFDDINSYSNQGYNEQTLQFEEVVDETDGKYIFDVADATYHHNDLSRKFVTFTSLPAPSLKGIVDFGIETGIVAPSSPWLYFNEIDLNFDGLPDRNRSLWLFDESLGEFPWVFSYVDSVNYTNYPLTPIQDSWIRYKRALISQGSFYSGFELYFEDIDVNNDGIIDHVIDYGTYNSIAIPYWETATHYELGTLAYFDGYYSECIVDHISNDLNLIGEQFYWSVVPRWTKNTSYVSGDIIQYNHMVYQVVISFVSGTDFSADGIVGIIPTYITPTDETVKFNFDFGRDYGTPITDFGSLNVQGFVSNHPSDDTKVIVSVPQNINKIATSWANGESVYNEDYIFKCTFTDNVGTSTIFNLLPDHDLEPGQTVLLMSADPERDPTGASWNTPEILYTVSTVVGSKVTLVDSSGDEVKLSEGSLPYVYYEDVNGNIFGAATFTMMRISIPSFDVIVKIDYLDYDILYDRFLSSASLPQYVMSSPGRPVITLVDHGFETMDRVKFNSAEVDESGDIAVNTIYYVRVITSSTFTVHETIDDAGNNVNPLYCNASNIGSLQAILVEFWYTGTLESLQPTHETLDSEEILIDDLEYNTINSGYARPGYGTGAVSQLMTSSIGEHISITVLQDDRIYSIGQPNVDDIYSRGSESGKQFVFRLDKGDQEVSWNLRQLTNASTTTLKSDYWYDDNSLELASFIDTDNNLIDVNSEYIKLSRDGIRSLPQAQDIYIAYPGDEFIDVIRDSLYTTFSVNGVTLIRSIDYVVISASRIKLTTMYTDPAGTQIVALYTDPVTTILYTNNLRGVNGTLEGGKVISNHSIKISDSNSAPVDAVKHAINTKVYGLKDISYLNLRSAYYDVGTDGYNQGYSYSSQSFNTFEIDGSDIFVNPLLTDDSSFAVQMRDNIGSSDVMLRKGNF